MNENKKKFYKTNWFMWVMLVFLAPVGIIMLWTKKDVKFTKKTKGILTGVFAIFFIIVLVNKEPTSEKKVVSNYKEVIEESAEKTEEKVADDIFVEAPKEETPKEVIKVEEVVQAPVVEEPVVEAPAVVVTPTEQPTISNKITVYITPTGKKYHRIDKCGKGSYSPTEVDESILNSGNKCGKCFN
ncbi:hypothetical protein KPL39_18110 [Clostridium gasigenes]|uniref:hypothetical protein n=1 Tax=Clostridium gasigenes TaxID=94869 RepID=UPI001C0B05D8|nr:hypothetical protein [Clostridium gasigenes]MBU3138148.1 hypothetical protein [Clostridium gasigenes]